MIGPERRKMSLLSDMIGLEWPKTTAGQLYHYWPKMPVIYCSLLRHYPSWITQNYICKGHLDMSEVTFDYIDYARQCMSEMTLESTAILSAYFVCKTTKNWRTGSNTWTHDAMSASPTGVKPSLTDKQKGQDPRIVYSLTRHLSLKVIHNDTELRAKTSVSLWSPTMPEWQMKRTWKTYNRQLRHQNRR